MYHQFKELAGVDITKEPMEVGPTCHYMMGGVRVDADTTQGTVPGLFAAGEVAGGMHGVNRLGGNSLSDLLVFGRRAGQHAALYAQELRRAADVDARQSWRRSRARCSSRSSATGGENPYAIQADLQETMQNLVGIIRTEAELKEAVKEIEALKERAAKVRGRGRARRTTPAGTPRSTCTRCSPWPSARRCAALERKESRGGHTRDDHPVHRRHVGQDQRGRSGLRDGRIRSRREPLPEMPAELKALFEERK